MRNFKLIFLRLQILFLKFWMKNYSASFREAKFFVETG